MTDHFPGLVQAFVIKSGGAELVLWPHAFHFWEISHPWYTL